MINRFAVLIVGLSCGLGSFAGPLLNYQQINLVSDVPGMAANTDSHLKNPWGISSSATSPIWVSDQVTGVSTLYNGSGSPQSLVVTMPNNENPTGQVNNGNTAIFSGDAFIFATLQGTIDGWKGSQGTSAANLFTGPMNAVYTGLALDTNASGTFLLAADTAHNHVDVYNSSGATTLSGNFTDPNLPANYAIYNIQVLNGFVYVTYQKTTSDGGIVDRFDLNGGFLNRIALDGPLVSPWGLAIAPALFGPASNDLLVGNEDEGGINVFNPLTGAFIGTLSDSKGNELVNTGLWGLKFGNGGSGGDPNTLYFAAGINNENDGLVGSIVFTPEPGTIGMFLASSVLLAIGMRVRRKQ